MFSILASSPAGRELGEEDVEGGGDQVHEVRVRDEGDEDERDRGVEEPHRQVDAAQRALPQPDRRAWPAPARSRPATTAPTTASPPRAGTPP